MSPKVYLVGAGPGAPDLLTVRAARLLADADIVFFDALVHSDTLALAGTAVKISVGKRHRKPSPRQEVINRALVRAAFRHRTVVRLKGGDPMIFGRAHEEIEALERAGVDWEVVPGVTAALAASAELGVSLTRRGLSRSVAFVTPAVGAEQERTDWASAVLAADTAAIYMGAGEAERIAAALLARGLSHTAPVVMITNVSLPDQAMHWGTLASLPRIASRRGEAPAIILIGRILDEALQDILQDREGAGILFRLTGPLVAA